jgi:hypothetical protein
MRHVNNYFKRPAFDYHPISVIETKIEIDRATRRKMEKTIEDFAKATGKTAEDGIKRMAKSSCKRLATTVHPYGLKGGGKMDKFIKNLAIQVGTAWFGTNVGAFPATSSMREAHRNARSGRTMRVPARKFRKEKGKPWLGLISGTDRDSHVKEIQSRAFRAKAAWVKVANDLGGPKMSGVSALVNRHLNGAMGKVAITGKGMQTKVIISNDAPYVGKIQTSNDVAKAQIDGMKNGLKYMKTVTQKEIEKANRAL